MQLSFNKNASDTASLSLNHAVDYGRSSSHHADKRTDSLHLREIHEMVRNSSRIVAQRRAFDELAGAEKRPGLIALQGTTKTGLPDDLKSGIENLSGYSMDDVNVHYNSSRPSQFQAHAYAQGTDIYLAPGQLKYLPHEAWHIVQQKQGRVSPTAELNGEQINNNELLESEADSMGKKADENNFAPALPLRLQQGATASQTIQRAIGLELEGYVPVMRQVGTLDKVLATIMKLYKDKGKYKVSDLNDQEKGLRNKWQELFNEDLLALPDILSVATKLDKLNTARNYLNHGFVRIPYDTQLQTDQGWLLKVDNASIEPNINAREALSANIIEYVSIPLESTREIDSFLDKVRTFESKVKSQTKELTEPARVDGIKNEFYVGPPTKIEKSQLAANIGRYNVHANLDIRTKDLHAQTSAIIEYTDQQSLHPSKKVMTTLNNAVQMAKKIVNACYQPDDIIKQELKGIVLIVVQYLIAAKDYEENQTTIKNTIFMLPKTPLSQLINFTIAQETRDWLTAHGDKLWGRTLVVTKREEDQLLFNWFDAPDKPKVDYKVSIFKDYKISDNIVPIIEDASHMIPRTEDKGTKPGFDKRRPRKTHKGGVYEFRQLEGVEKTVGVGLLPAQIKSMAAKWLNMTDNDD